MSESNEEIAARLKKLDAACSQIEKDLEQHTPELRFNILINCLAKLVCASNNAPLILGMAVIGLSQAIAMNGEVEIDIEEKEDERKPQSTH